jgi:hypothetical protein
LVVIWSIVRLRPGLFQQVRGVRLYGHLRAQLAHERIRQQPGDRGVYGGAVCHAGLSTPSWAVSQPFRVRAVVEFQSAGCPCHSRDDAAPVPVSDRGLAAIGEASERAYRDELVEWRRRC